MSWTISEKVAVDRGFLLSVLKVETEVNCRWGLGGVDKKTAFMMYEVCIAIDVEPGVYNSGDSQGFQ